VIILQRSQRLWVINRRQHLQHLQLYDIQLPLHALHHRLQHVCLAPTKYLPNSKLPNSQIPSEQPNTLRTAKYPPISQIPMPPTSQNSISMRSFPLSYLINCINCSITFMILARNTLPLSKSRHFMMVCVLLTISNIFPASAVAYAWRNRCHSRWVFGALLPMCT